MDFFSFPPGTLWPSGSFFLDQTSAHGLGLYLKLIAPNREDTPAKCKLNIAKSTDPPECDWILANGGYQ